MNETNGQTDAKVTKRWWRFQYSLRTLMIVVTLSCVFFSWFAVKLQQARRQAAAIAALEKLGVDVYYYHQWDAYLEAEKARGFTGNEYTLYSGLLYAVDMNCMPSNVPTPGPAWLRYFFGDDLFREVIGVSPRSWATPEGIVVDYEMVVAELPAFPSIKAINLPEDLHLTDACLASLANTDSLECVKLGERWPYLGGYINKPIITTKGLDHLAKLHDLKVLQLNDLGTSDADTRFIGKLQNLETLELVGEEFGDQTLAYLSNLKNLKSLHLSETSITDKGLSHLSTLHNLEDLAIRDADITDEGLKHFQNLKGLHSLSLSSTSVNGTGVKHLSGLPQLQFLSLDHSPVTDDTLAGLKDLWALTSVSLAGNAFDVTGATLDHMNELNLSQITISGTQITAADLLKWKKLPDIQFMSISPGMFTAEELGALKAKAPQLQILQL